MPSNFPTTLDTTTNLPDVEKYDQLDQASAVPHNDLETTQDQAILALEAKTGIDNSGVTTSHDYRIRQLEGSVGAPITPTTGTGSPEAVVTGGLGRIYFDITDPDAVSLWVKTTASGNTGWKQLLA